MWILENNLSPVHFDRSSPQTRPPYVGQGLSESYGGLARQTYGVLARQTYGGQGSQKVFAKEYLTSGKI